MEVRKEGREEEWQRNEKRERGSRREKEEEARRRTKGKLANRLWGKLWLEYADDYARGTCSCE